MATDYRPKGYTNVTPYLVVKDGAAQIDFLQKAFNAELVDVVRSEEGRVIHAEVKIGDAMVMLGEASGNGSPMPSMLYCYLPDTDFVYQKAIDAGAKSIQEPKDMFYGDRNAAIEDSNGNQWWIATHQETLTSEEIAARAGEGQK